MASTYGSYQIDVLFQNLKTGKKEKLSHKRIELAFDLI